MISSYKGCLLYTSTERDPKQGKTKMAKLFEKNSLTIHFSAKGLSSSSRSQPPNQRPVVPHHHKLYDLISIKD